MQSFCAIADLAVPQRTFQVSGWRQTLPTTQRHGQRKPGPSSTLGCSSHILMQRSLGGLHQGVGASFGRRKNAMPCQPAASDSLYVKPAALSLQLRVAETYPGLLDLDPCQLNNLEQDPEMLESFVLQHGDNEVILFWDAAKAQANQLLEDTAIATSHEKTLLTVIYFVSALHQSRPEDLYTWLSLCLKAPDQPKHAVWATRCMSAAQLAVQLSNMPGTDQEAVFAAQAPLGSPTSPTCSPLDNMFFQEAINMQLAAVVEACKAATWLQQPDLEAQFLNLEMLFCSHHWSDKSMLSTRAEALAQLAHIKALSEHPKPGGYSVKQAEVLLKQLTSLRHAEAASFVKLQLALHKSWCTELKPALQRSKEIYNQFGIASLEWTSACRAVQDIMQIGLLELPTDSDTFTSGWNKACLSTLRPLSHDILATIALAHVSHGRVSQAHALIKPGLATSTPDNQLYHAAAAALCKQSFPSDSITLEQVQELLVWWSRCLRQANLPTLDMYTDVFARAVARAAKCQQEDWLAILTNIIPTLCVNGPTEGFKAAASAQVVSAIQSEFKDDRQRFISALGSMLQQGSVVGLPAHKAFLQGLVLTTDGDAELALQLLHGSRPKYKGHLMAQLCKAGEEAFLLATLAKINKPSDEGKQDQSNPVSALKSMMELLNYCSDEQVSLACKMVDAVVPSDHELQGVLLNHMCDKAEMNMVLGRLQKQPQVLAPDNESLQRFVQRLATAEDLAALSSSLAKASSSAAVVVSLLITACHTSLTASWNLVDLAWCLYSHAHANGLVISMEAQDAMWQGQTGARRVQMYRQWQSGELRRPSAGRLSTVASVLVNRRHWAEAMVIAKEVAREKPAAAAGIASCVLGGMGMSPESAELLSVAMPWFEQHDLHQQAVKLFTIKQQYHAASITSQDLVTALKAWLSLGNTKAAYAALQQHCDLAERWTANQHTQVVSQLHTQLDLDAEQPIEWQFIWQLCIMGFQQKHLSAPAQVDQLILTYVTKNRLAEALQLAQLAVEHSSVKPSSLAALLHMSLRLDVRSKSSSASGTTEQALSWWKSHHGASWARKLEADTAVLVADLLLAQEEWHKLIHLWEQQCFQDNEAVCQPVWDAAVLALQHKDDLEGGFLAWEWAAKFHPDWSPAHPADYAFLTKAVACFHANPTKGIMMLLAYPECGFEELVSEGDCQFVMQQCIFETDGVANQIGQKPVLKLLNAMEPPFSPLPSIDTVLIATKAILRGVGTDLSARQVLLQLYQKVLPRLHAAHGNREGTAAVYEEALTAFAASKDTDCCATETVQIVLLMAQNGLPGLTQIACEYFAEISDEYTEGWFRSVFGDSFMDQVWDVVASVEDSQSVKATAVAFPAHELPTLDVDQADYPQMLVLQGMQTPDWMGQYRWS